jgi:hypothetical protein
MFDNTTTLHPPYICDGHGAGPQAGDVICRRTLAFAAVVLLGQHRDLHPRPDGSQYV